MEVAKDATIEVHLAIEDWKLNYNLGNVVKYIESNEDYLDGIFKNANDVSSTQIAADYGWSLKGFNEILSDYGLVYERYEQFLMGDFCQIKGYVSVTDYNVGDSNFLIETKEIVE